MKTVNTVTGTISTDKLGTTLVHEHLLVGWAGWELDCKAPRFERKTALKTGRRTPERTQGSGPQHLRRSLPQRYRPRRRLHGRGGRRQRRQRRLLDRTLQRGLGQHPLFRQRSVDEIADVYAAELSEGVGETGIKAGLIKCATGKDRITEYEQKCLRAAARASKRTGAPITTHTEDGTMGREQLDLFAEEGVDLARSSSAIAAAPPT